MKLRTALLLAAACVLAPVVAHAQVPTPESFFGFEIGTDRKLATWEQLTAYYSRLAETSPRVTIDTLGRATKG